MILRKCRLVCVVMCVAVFSSIASAGQITVADIHEMQNDLKAGSFSALAQWNGLSYYLQGVVEGVAAQRKALEESDTKGVFCPPPRKNYSLEEVFTLLSDVTPRQRTLPAAEVLFSKYQAMHPC